MRTGLLGAHACAQAIPAKHKLVIKRAARPLSLIFFKVSPNIQGESNRVNGVIERVRQTFFGPFDGVG